MSLYVARGAPDLSLSDDELKSLLHEALEKLGPRQRVLAVPPDQTRIHSRAGELTRFAWEYYGDRLKAVLPALGTHAPMSPEQLTRMYGAIPHEIFRVHNWRADVETLGEIPSDFIEKVSEGKLHYSWPAQTNRLISRGGHDLVLSIGKVVPHEVIGMANYTKNILVGAGGPDGINRTEFTLLTGRRPGRRSPARTMTSSSTTIRTIQAQRPLMARSSTSIIAAF